MGTWTFISATPKISLRNDLYGHVFAIDFKLKYVPSRFGSFVEMPRLEWKETITMMEARKGTYWQVEFDQYARNPSSLTFYSWVNRYITMYYCVYEQKYATEVCKLWDKNGVQLPKGFFGKLTDNQERADLVRDYIKRKGAIVSVLVSDTPAINKPSDTTVHKNRILTFDCGLKGMGTRVKAVQHLIVDGAQPEQKWFRECVLTDTSRPFSFTGLQRTNPPPDVTVNKPFAGSADQGEYL